MDNDFRGDDAELARTISTHEVVAVRFVTVGRRLLLDFRSTDLDGPLIKVVPAVRSARERYESLRTLRPRFELPGRIVAAAWPGYVRSLGMSAAWGAVAQRIEESGHPAVIEQAERALAELEQSERETHMNAIRGDGFRTLWSTSARQR